MNGCNFFWKQCKLSKPSFQQSQLVNQDKVRTFTNVGLHTVSLEVSKETENLKSGKFSK